MRTSDQSLTDLRNMPAVKFAALYERLRSERQAGSICEFDADWCAVQREMADRCRRDGGLKTKHFTYSWNHREDCLRRLPSYTPSARVEQTPYLPRVVRTPAHLRNADEVPDWFGVRG